MSLTVSLWAVGVKSAVMQQLPHFPRAEEVTFAMKGLFNYGALSSKTLRSKMENEVGTSQRDLAGFSVEACMCLPVIL